MWLFSDTLVAKCLLHLVQTCWVVITEGDLVTLPLAMVLFQLMVLCP